MDDGEIPRFERLVIRGGRSLAVYAWLTSGWAKATRRLYRRYDDAMIRH